jgi:hypothetical protein
LASLLVYGVYMLLPSAAVVVAARLIDVHQPGGQSLNWRRLIPGLLLAGVLLLLVSYQLTLASIWDVATDGLRGLFLAQIVGGTALVAAVLLAWSLPGRWKLMALAFAVIVPFWMNTARTLGTYDPDGKWGKLPTLLTEQRAQTITDALQRYHDHTGRYPESLAELAPWYLVSVPTPYIIPGQSWCYSGGSNYYRLGYASRQSFSSPIAARLYAGVGQPPDPAWHCP